MQTIDAHQHFWIFDPIRDNWITEEMAVLRRDFLPQDLYPLLQAEGIDGCVAVQADQSEQETHFLLSLSAEFDFIKGVVGWVDLRAENLEDRLEFFSSFSKLKGFRHIVQTEPQEDFILRADFNKGIALLNQYGFSYDILVFPRHLSYVHSFINRFPEQRFVIDHLAKPYIREQKLSEWKKDIMEIGKHPHVYCKLSGLVTEGAWERWHKKDFTPYLDAVVEAFGTERIMYGSDWPVCLLAASYAKVIDIIKDYFSSYSKSEQERVFGLNAIQFYNLT